MASAPSGLQTLLLPLHCCYCRCWPCSASPAGRFAAAAADPAGPLLAAAAAGAASRPPLLHLLVEGIRMHPGRLLSQLCLQAAGRQVDRLAIVTRVGSDQKRINPGQLQVLIRVQAMLPAAQIHHPTAPPPAHLLEALSTHLAHVQPRKRMRKAQQTQTKSNTSRPGSSEGQRCLVRAVQAAPAVALPLCLRPLRLVQGSALLTGLLLLL